MKPIKILFCAITVFFINFSFAQSENSKEVEIKNGYLKFNNEEIFESVINLDETKKSEMLKAVKGFDEFKIFTKEQFIKEKGEDDLEKSEVDYENAKPLFTLLNSDGMLQVGKYLIRINLSTKFARVLDEENANEEEVSKMINNESSENIGSFPLDVDLFGALEEGFKSMPTDEKTISNSEALRFPIPGPQYRGHESMFWNPTKPGDKSWEKNENLMVLFHMMPMQSFFICMLRKSIKS